MNDTKKILLVEDDPEIVENLTEFLRTEGYSVTSVPTQKETMELLDRDRFDLMLLDVTLKQGNGYSVCTAVKAKYDMPVIFLTALDDEFSVVTGLIWERTIISASPSGPVNWYPGCVRYSGGQGGHSPWSSVRDIRIDTEKGTVSREGEEIFLSALEYRLLLVFVNHKGMILTRVHAPG